MKIGVCSANSGPYTNREILIEARAIARRWADDYLGLPSYANNWRRLGYRDDDAAAGVSDRLIDAGIAWGSVDDVARRIRAHLDAGADHVCV